MMRSYSLALFVFAAIFQGQAQTTDLVFFTDDAAKFILVIDGEEKNATPAARVVATGIRTESPMVMVKFEDAAIPQMRKPGYFPLGMEYTIMITTNKKGERVLRPTGEAALGTAAGSASEKIKPTTFVDDVPVAKEPVVDEPVSGDVVTTTTVIEEEAGGTGENVNISMGMNGVGVNMNINVNDGIGASGTTTTTTRTTTSTTTTRTASSTSVPTVTPGAVKPVKEPEVYHMPGYTGPIGCGWPMSTTEFEEAKRNIAGHNFEDTKMTTAKQIGRDRCFTVEQVKGMVSLFNFEDSKLEFAKYAYERTYDIGNYYQVNKVFTFESSVDELNTYIQSR